MNQRQVAWLCGKKVLDLGRGIRYDVGMTNNLITFACPTCQLCGETATVEVTHDEWTILTDPRRPNIQDALPNRTPAERELFITGTHDACWDEMFKEED